MGLNIAGCHTLGVHGQDFLLNVLTDAGLVLFQYLRLKFPFPIPWDRYLHIPKAGTQGFAAVSIAAVVCVLALVVVFAIAPARLPALPPGRSP